MKSSSERYLVKAERPLILRPFLLITLSVTLVFFALRFLFMAHRELGEAFVRHVVLNVSRPLTRLVGMVPLSLTETLFILGVLLLAALGVRACYRFYQLPGRRIRRFIRGATSLLAAALTLFNLFFFFHLFNFTRLPLLRQLKLEEKDLRGSDEELYRACMLLSGQMNELRSGLPHSREGVLALPGTRFALLSKASEGLKPAEAKYPFLKPGNPTNPKPILLSKLFSYMGISGFYSPFLLEAHVNIDQPDLVLPCTALHELAHVQGFAAEDEAETLAFLFGRSHPEPAYRYSALYMAWSRLMRLLQSRNQQLWQNAFSNLSAEVRRDHAELETYWSRHRGRTMKQVEKINDSFLKTAGQTAGIEAYDQAALLIFAVLKKEGALKP